MKETMKKRKITYEDYKMKKGRRKEEENKL